MTRHWFAAMFGLASLTAPAFAGTWADAMFKDRSRDFGSVQRGPTLTHAYQLTNNTNYPIHIANVRVSCGCVSAGAMQTDVAPGQSTSILANMDTRRFMGPKQVTIFVTLHRPQWE